MQVEGQTTQWTKEKGQKKRDKRTNTDQKKEKKTTIEITKDRATRTPLKRPRMNSGAPEKCRSSSICGTCRVTLVTHLVISHE